jgi:hypothetical protein
MEKLNQGGTNMNRQSSLPSALSHLRGGCEHIWAEHHRTWSGRQPARWIRQKGIQRSTLEDFKPRLYEALPLIQCAIPAAQSGNFFAGERYFPSAALMPVLSFLSDRCDEAARYANRGGPRRETLEDLEQTILRAIPLVDAAIDELEQAEFDEVAEVNRPVAEWMRSACERSGSSEIGTLHASYCAWCQEESRNLTPCGLEGFVDVLCESAFTEMTSVHRRSMYDEHAFPTHVRGLQLKPAPPGDEAVPTTEAEHAA